MEKSAWVGSPSCISDKGKSASDLSSGYHYPVFEQPGPDHDYTGE